MIKLYVPKYEDLWFRQMFMADEETMADLIICFNKSIRWRFRSLCWTLRQSMGAQKVR